MHESTKIPSRNKLVKRSGAVIICSLLGICLLKVPASPEVFNTASIEGIRQGLVSADSKAICEALISLVEKNPFEPYALLMYPDIVRCAEITGFQRIDALLEKNQGIALGKENTKAAFLIRMYREQLHENYFHAEKPKEKSTLQYIRSWQLAQFGNRYGSGDLYQPVRQLTEDMPRTVHVKEEGSSGWIFPSRYLYRKGGLIYARTNISISQPVNIRIMSNNRYRGRINNRDILLNDGLDKRNMRLVSVSGTGAVSLEIMFCDSDDISFRVLVTDEADRPVNTPPVNIQGLHSGGTAVEGDGFPWERILAEKNSYPEWAFHLLKGIYLESLDCDSAAVEYTMSLEQRPDPVTEFFLASFLLYTEKNRGSARWHRGYGHILKLASQNIKFPPAQWKAMEVEMEDGDFASVFTRCDAFIRRYPRYMPAWSSFLSYLSSRGCDREFRDMLERFREIFPQSQLPAIFAAYHLREKDPEQYNTMMLSLLGEHLPEIYLQDLVKNLGEAGKYRDLRSILEAPRNIARQDDDLYDVLFRMKDFSTLRTLLLKNAGVYPGPSVFLRLGLLDRLKGGDGLHFLTAAREQDRSLFGIGDYTAYCTQGDYTRIYNFEMNKGPLELTEKEDDIKVPVLSRDWFFELEENGSRAFIRESIRINKPEDIERYGEYQVPLQGEVIPLRIGVTGRDGVSADSCRMTRINDKTYITINGLQIGSRLDIYLMINNPLKRASDSGFYYLPFTLLQDYDEPVRKLSLTIRAPLTMPLNFAFPETLALEKKTGEDYANYMFRADNLPSVAHEPNSLSDETVIPSIAFTTMGSTGDFSTWYSSLLQRIDSKTDRSELVKKTGVFRAKTRAETIRSIYHHVSSTLLLDRNILFYPENPLDVIARGRGTVEDKVLLARAMLREHGIISHPAFLCDGSRPGAEKYTGPDRFDSILLYIPDEGKEGTWLDFSSQWLGCGDLTFRVQGRNAVIVKDNGFDNLKVADRRDSMQDVCFDFEPEKSGNISIDCTLTLSGTYGDAREHLRNKKYHAETLYRFLSERIPDALLDSYIIENQDHEEKPLIIRIKGSVSDLWVPAGDGLILEPMAGRSRLFDYMTGTVRKQSLYLAVPVLENDIFRYRLPEEYSGFSMEKNSELRCPWGRAEFQLTKESGSPYLVVRKKIEVDQGTVPPDRIPEFIKFCTDVRQMENQRLFLKRDR